MRIPLIDLAAQYAAIREELDAAVHGVLASGTYILGPQVAALEEEIAAYLGVRHAVGVASGTDALALTLRAMGVGPGDEVLVPAYTFFATAEAVSHVGATPVFADITPRTYGLDPDQLEQRLTARTRVIIPVHLYGHPVEMEPILSLARRRGLRVLEDNAQAMGAEYRGRKTGALGDAGCLSFFPSKTLGGYGDGGMVVTDDDGLAETVRALRTHGWRTKYYPTMLGFNSRLDELQAAVLRVKLRHLDAWAERRRALAGEYSRLLANGDVGLPWEAAWARHAYHLYVVRLSDRDAARDALRARGIASGIYYPLPLHRLEPYRALGYPAEAFPESNRAAAETLAIPLYAELTPAQVREVAAAVLHLAGSRPAAQDLPEVKRRA